MTTPRSGGVRGRHRAARSSSRSTSALVAAALAALVVTLGIAITGTGWGSSYALFNDAATVNSGSFAAGAIAAPVLSTATQATGGQNVTLVWPATSVGAQTATATAYEVYRYPAATGGTGTLVCSTSGALTCTDTTGPTSTVYYQLRSKFMTNWFRDAGTRVSYTPDVTPPTVTITTPLNSCASARVACGTASDAGGGTVSKVEYTFQQTRTALGGLGGVTYYCWSGTAWVTTVATTCTTYANATGTTAWYVPGTPSYTASNLVYQYRYVLTVRGTDSYGNVSTPTTANLTT